MKKFIILLLEAIVLSILWSNQAWMSFWIWMAVYFFIGLINGKFLKDNFWKTFWWTVVAGAMAGALIAIFGPHNFSVGESKVVWFIIGFIMSVITRSIFPTMVLMYIPALAGILVGHKLQQKIQ